MHHFTVMQPLKPRKGHTYAILRYAKSIYGPVNPWYELYLWMATIVTTLPKGPIIVFFSPLG